MRIPSNSRRRGTVPRAVAVLACGIAGLAALPTTATATPERAAHPVTTYSASGLPRVVPEAAGTGGTSGSFDGTHRHDLLTRLASNGSLRVYPNRGNGFNGTATFGTAVTIATGWGNYTWVGQGDFNGDDYADVAAITPDGDLRIALNQGGLNGTNTLGPAQTVGHGFDTLDLVFVGDVEGDGNDDILGRRPGTNETIAYLNDDGPDGEDTFSSPYSLATTGPGVVNQFFGDVTGDTVPDLISVLSNGQMHIRDFTTGQPAADSYLISTGWNNATAICLTDVDGDELPDLLKRTSDGTLTGYHHTATFTPTNPTATYGSGQNLGGGWNINNIIS